MDRKAEIYAQVDGVLKAVGEDYRSKVPIKMKQLILKYKDKSSNTVYNMSIPLYKQNISKEALSIIALIHLNYWCKNDEEKAKLNIILKENGIKKEEERKKRYSPDDIFNKKNEQIRDSKEDFVLNNKQMIEYRENIFLKILNFIKKKIKR